MESHLSTSPASSNRPTYACVQCADRKIKCDRQRPCGGCLKHNVECIYRPAPQPARKRRKTTKDSNLTQKLKHYEALLHEQGISPESSTTSENRPQAASIRPNVGITKNTTPNFAPLSPVSESQQYLTKTQLLHDQDRATFVDNSLWTRVVEEFPTHAEALEENSPNGESDAEDDVEGLGYVLGATSRSKPTRLHPSPEHIRLLWQFFIDNVDPLTKVIHVPTMRPAVEKAIQDLNKIPRTMEALMFAIYSMAVVSLKDEQCQQIFGQRRKVLLSKYIGATKSGLTRTDFIGTGNIVVLQALVLHLLSIRDVYEPRVVWTLTGIAIRIAERMGLHRDGTSLGLPPFETEIRRRVWWLLKMHDYRTAELSGVVKFRNLVGDKDTTKAPLHINDDELRPGMTTHPDASSGATDMIYCAMKSDLGQFLANFIAKKGESEKRSDPWSDMSLVENTPLRDELNENVEEVLETKYIRYCDPSHPLQLLTMLTARSIINVSYFLTHHPRRWTDKTKIPEDERRFVWNICVKLLEQYAMTQSSPQLQHFSWNVGYYLQWHVFIHVLDTLRDDPLKTDAAKAWKLVEATYANTPDMVSNTKRVIHAAVGNLCLKAFDARQNALQDRGESAGSAPQFIIDLRQQREAAKVQKQTREARKRGANTNPTLTQVRANDEGHVDVKQFQPFVSTQPSGYGSARSSIATDSFWTMNGFNDTPFDLSNSAFNLDVDLMMAQDPIVVDDNAQTIDWTQWDSWIGHSSMPPLDLGLDSNRV